MRARRRRRRSHRPDTWKHTGPTLMLTNMRPPQVWFCILQIGGLVTVAKCFRREKKTVVVNNQQERIMKSSCLIENTTKSLDVHYRTSKHRNE